MNAERLLEHFERISEAPDAVARLRRFILDLAVRGKLVEQDPEDEPAEELLESITAEKRYLEKLGDIRASKKIPDSEEPPFGIPMTWAWTQLACIGSLSPRNIVSDSSSVSFVPMPLISSEYGVPNGHEVRPWGEIKKGYTHFAEGDVGLAKITPCFENGKSTVFRSLAGGIGSGTTELHIIRPLQVSPDFILLFLKSPHFIQTGIPRMTGTAGQKRVPLDYFAHSPFPLPPLAEQHRIVAKVDELMALCDQLEAARLQREQDRERLEAATLQRLNQPAEDPANFRNDASFALQVLPSLTTTPAQIKRLRQTILNLALRGKLVEQDPEDEPAEELLEVINGERRLLLMSGYPNVDEARAQLRKQASVSEPVPPHWLPAGWAWTTLMRCSALVVDCRNKTAPYVLTGVPLVRTTNVKEGGLVMEDMRYVDEGIAKIWSSRCEPQPGDILITREAPMGEACIIPEDMRICLGQRMMLARMVPGTIFNRYILYMLRDPFLMDRVQDKPVGATVQHLRVGGIESLLVPLPPLAEQHRIVAKVDELMALCDQLEQQLSQADQQRRRLLEAVLAEALGGRLPTEEESHANVA